ncbi:60S ribosomal protein L10a-1-like [Pyrus ussuriensis x Pyrus communis]|uniref:60S ribosomal protein L10a-1-like n=1 Tax=Pyrus ussuriensis x Pyrus communis TaxID=2448454 RepID=A0A5N5FZA8_9ROSA|nr:60S ribosomal protein L10a-1-like [Pyrus ussuriensis x Pyrus communis]
MLSSFQLSVHHHHHLTAIGSSNKTLTSVRCLNLKTTMGKPFRVYGEIGRLPLEMRWQVAI